MEKDEILELSGENGDVFVVLQGKLILRDH